MSHDESRRREGLDRTARQMREACERTGRPVPSHTEARARVVRAIQREERTNNKD